MEDIELFKINETLSFKFYQMPKELFRNPLYKDKLSLEAKVVYSLLLDRLEVSRLNRWFNENGEIYLIYTRKDIIKDLGIGSATATNIFKELRECNLIKEERLGRGFPNRIYIGKIKSEDLVEFKNRVFRNSQEEFLEVLDRISRNSKENTNNTNMNNTDLNVYNDEQKFFFAEKVSLKQKELNSLIEQYGSEKTAKIIVALDLYKKSSGKEYDSDYDAMLNWVINKVERDEKKDNYKNKKNLSYKNYQQRDYEDFEQFYDI